MTLPDPPARLKLTRRPVLALLGAGLLAGCASPTPTLYSLAPVPGPILGARARIILVREVSLARYLERSPIVLSSADYRLDVAPNNWWGEPLAPMVTRVLAADLALRLPASTVLAETIAITVTPDLSVELSVQQFDRDSTGAVVLAAAFALPGPRGTPPPETFRTSIMPATRGLAGGGAAQVGAQVAAMSAALGQLADVIARRIAAGPSGRS
ncbi:MAG TPA: PqiC family protein [Acetobacteraceae bacterium]|nr:PqiC family protein [Acetobacteraceae bacterium]